MAGLPLRFLAKFPPSRRTLPCVAFETYECKSGEHGRYDHGKTSLAELDALKQRRDAAHEGNEKEQEQGHR